MTWVKLLSMITNPNPNPNPNPADTFAKADFHDGGPLPLASAGRFSSERESRIAMGPCVVPLSIGDVDGRSAGQRSRVAVEAGADDGGRGGGSGRGGHRSGRRRTRGRRQRQLIVTSWHAVQHLGQVSRSLQNSLLQ